jgi:hypothetical protein
MLMSVETRVKNKNNTKFIVVSDTLIAASLLVTQDSPLVEYKCGHVRT